MQITSVDDDGADDADEDLTPPSPMKTFPDNDSGIDRGTGANSRVSQNSASSGNKENAKLWASFKKHVRK